MIKKTLTYDDLDGNSITEDFYFNLTKAEIAEMQLGTEGGLDEHLKTIVKSQNQREIMNTFKMILENTVGRRSDDGKRFEKSAKISADFMQSNAYSELFISLLTDADAASAFIRGVIPANMADKLDDRIGIESVLGAPAISGTVDFPLPKTSTDYTDQELLDMSQDEFDKVAGTNIRSMPKRVLVVAMQRVTKS